ncbi:MAG TPA: ABC transporter substrate-binding protein, partial [Abditibacteriaceae bacterium]|nr:ABC transporter substrate-binding protein [Abditibacteriaceae bacterium]
MKNMKFSSLSLRLAMPLAFSLLAISLLGGCNGAARAPKTLMLAMTNDPATLDPAKAYDTASLPFVRVLYRGLVDYDEKANIANEVAQSRSVSSDGKTYTFKLRPDVYFSSGRRVVANDFRYALERVLDPATASEGLSQYTMIDGAEEYTKAKTKNAKADVHVRGIQTPDANTIIFRLKAPNATFLNYLALPFSYAVPREQVEKYGKEFGEHPDGCGPFVLDEWVHDAWIKLKRNPNHFRPDFPRADRLEMQIGVSSTLQTMLFEQGRIDVLSLNGASGPEYLRLKRNPQWAPLLLHAPEMDVRYLCLNTEMKPFDDVRVRQAMNYAINRDRIVSFQNGRATKARGALPPGMPAYNAQLFQYAYNPEKAKQLLREAGYAKGFPRILTLWYSNASPWIP